MEHKIKLAKTELLVSPISFGTVRAGLDWDGLEADRMIDHYIDNGGNLIDTARVYLDYVGSEIGRSERVIGDWLRRSGRRNEVVLMTKGGHPDRNLMHVSRMTKPQMEYDLNLSLKTLGVNDIDIYFFHRDDPQQSVGTLIEMMEDFRRAGKIRYYGCSNWTCQRMFEAEEYAKTHSLTGFVASQNLFNIGSKYMRPFADDTMQTVDRETLDFYKKSMNTPMPYFGMCSGFFHKLEQFGQNAVANSCYYTKENLLISKKILELRDKYDCTTSQVLLGFYFVQDLTIIPLVGSCTIAQLDDTLGATEIKFDKNDYCEIGVML